MVAGDIRRHVGSGRIGYEEVHGGHGVGAPTEDGIKGGPTRLRNSIPDEDTSS